MRRVSARFATVGMKLARDVYDNGGFQLFHKGMELTEEHVTKLRVYNVSEVIIDDWRVEDVPVLPMYAPEDEGFLVQALTTLIGESIGQKEIDPDLIEGIDLGISRFTRAIVPTAMGELNCSGGISREDFYYHRPVRVAGLAMMLAKRAGMGLMELADVGVAAALMDVGVIAMGPLLLDGSDFVMGDLKEEGKGHPALSAEVLRGNPHIRPATIEYIEQHHEQFDGGGYPNGLAGANISLGARAIFLAHAYYEAVSKRAKREALMPHEAIEFIMSESGSAFDPQLVQTFLHEIAAYPMGITVRLNTGEGAIVINSNLGIPARPVVRIAKGVNKMGELIADEYDLSEPEHEHRMVVSVLDY